MTIETIATQKVSQRRDSNSSNGYQESHSEDDGYFTSAVSVQHKVNLNSYFWYSMETELYTIFEEA